MDALSSWQWVETVGGVLLMGFVLLDVFLTVLYARVGYGIMSKRIARTTWWGFRTIGKAFPRHCGRIASFCGPAIVVLLIGIWGMTLTVGAALVIHPRLGRSVVAESGASEHDFATALFVANGSLSIVTSSGYVPASRAMKLGFVFNSLAGTAVLSLTLTYLMQVYLALNQRNALALKVHLASVGTGDAAELIARLGIDGRFDTAGRALDELMAELAHNKESHHLYPVLFYFRFPLPYYSIGRLTFVIVDLVTLMNTTLSDEYRWLRDSASVHGLAIVSSLLLDMLSGDFAHAPHAAETALPDPVAHARWAQRYHKAVRRLQMAGIRTPSDTEFGAESYVEQRSAWDAKIEVLAQFIAEPMSDIDVATEAAGNVETLKG